MKLTDYLAIWGAVLSSIVALWSIYREFIKRDRVRVNAGFQIYFPPKQEVFVFTIRNLSDHKIRITHCWAYPDRHFQTKWIDAIARRLVKRSTTGFLFSFQSYQGPALPCTIEARDYTMLMYTVPPPDLPKLKSLGVTTADGREWFCPRSNILAI